MRELVQQRENPAVRRVAAVQQNHRQRTVRDTDSPHFIHGHFAALEYQNSKTFHCGPPSIESSMSTWPRKLRIPRNAEDFANSIPDRFSVF